MSERLCIFCEHCQWEDSRGMGSTMTGPYGSIGFSCNKGHFSNYESESFQDIGDARALFLKAKTCPDYLQPLDTQQDQEKP